MKSIILFTTFIFPFVFASCKNRKETTETAQSEISSSILVDNFDSYRNSTSTAINGVTIEKNTMTISVSYSGGCEKHEFQLIGSKTIQKSLPPKRGIMLYHTNNGDSCRELVEEDLHFDISNLAYQNNEIILVLESYEPTISYTAVD